LYVDARGLRDSAHDLVTCLTCHTDREVCPPDREGPLEFSAYWAEATEMCIRCHLAGAGDYADSAHGRSILSGEGDGATCVDCHSLEPSGHTTGWVSDPRLQLAPKSVEESCGRCHEQALRSYRQTSHSKLTRFSDAESWATCTTCHGDHAVMAVDEPGEPLNAASLVTVCRECHENADGAFAAGWLGHETLRSQPDLLHYGGRGIVLVMALSLGFGLVHIALDLARPLANRSRRGGGHPR
jgi:hypothetical protein